MKREKKKEKKKKKQEEKRQAAQWVFPSVHIFHSVQNVWQLCLSLKIRNENTICDYMKIELD